MSPDECQCARCEYPRQKDRETTGAVGCTVTKMTGWNDGQLHSASAQCMSAVVFDKASTHLTPPTCHQHRSAKANQPDSSLQFCATDVYSATTCSQVRCVDGQFESTAHSCFRVTKSLEASFRPTQTVMDADH